MNQRLYIAALIVGLPLLYGLANSLPHPGMMLFWLGFFFAMKPLLRLKTWYHAFLGAALSTMLYFLVILW